jgi:signal transduction histidine kinase/DNA-binding response OmpR family regulator/predicted RNA-binding protein with RPS1 domain
MTHIGQMAEVIIDHIYSHGVFVYLKNTQTKAYIRRRELTLSRNINPINTFHPGEELNAIVIALPSEGRLLELSVRLALPDPWTEFAQRVKINDVINGFVKYLYSHKVVVEIEPGVDGTIAVEEISDASAKKPEDVLWINDHVQAVVTSIDPASKKLHLSMRKLLNRLLYANDVLENISKIQSLSLDLDSEVHTKIPYETQEKPINYFGKILVVDDQKDVRDPLVQWLVDAGCDAEGCESGLDALEKCKTQAYSLMIIDINMPVLDGIDLIKQLKQNDIMSIITIMTGSELAEYRGIELNTLGLANLFVKPLDLQEMRTFLMNLTLGKVQKYDFSEKLSNSPARARPFDQVLEAVNSAMPLHQRLLVALEYLLSLTNAESVALFFFDPISRLFTIKAQYGILAFDETILSNLVASPVEDVITEHEIVWEKRVSNHSSTFKKLNDIVQFESCVGVPVYSAGKCDHALFIFHREPNFFSRYRLRDVRTTAALCTIALENELFHSQVLNIAPIILTGQLASALNHEISNQLTGLDLQIDHLKRVITKIEHHNTSHDRKALIQDAGMTCSNLDQTVKDLRKIVTDFRKIRTVTPDEQIDVNQALKIVWENIRKTAAKYNVDIWLKIDEALPIMTGSPFSLYCIFYNLTLNAIQQLHQKPGERLVKIQTACDDNDGVPIISVRVMDNGPGIHRHQWEQIFDLGFTTRENGSGLGLFIARSLAGAMGGRIIVEESLVQFGTTFLVQFPVEFVK